MRTYAIALLIPFPATPHTKLEDSTASYGIGISNRAISHSPALTAEYASSLALRPTRKWEMSPGNDLSGPKSKITAYSKPVSRVWTRAAFLYTRKNSKTGQRYQQLPSF